VDVRRIHHVGMAVDDLDEAVQTYERLFGAGVENRGTLEDQGVEAVSVRLGEGRVELMSSLADDSPVGKFLAKRGPGMHHVAYEVADLPEALRELESSGAELIDERPRSGLFGLEVAFVHPDSAHGVLSELVTRGH
jgi:methylmalonyl-CoA/ethylmalonyl-CoA epimerase